MSKKYNHEDYVFLRLARSVYLSDPERALYSILEDRKIFVAVPSLPINHTRSLPYSRFKHAFYFPSSNVAIIEVPKDRLLLLEKISPVYCVFERAGVEAYYLSLLSKAKKALDASTGPL